MTSIFGAKTLVFSLNKQTLLLINTQTGAIDLVPSRIRHGAITRSEKILLDIRGYFSEAGDQSMLNRLKQIGKVHSQNVPYWFYVLMTLKCNFACPICYERRMLENSEISIATLEKTAKVIARIQSQRSIPANKMFLVIFGGEPLLTSSQRQLRRILDLADENAWKCIIVTNGTRVLENIELFESRRETIADFRITLDGPALIHDVRRPYRGGQPSFDDVVCSIELLLDAGHLVKMQTIFGAGNFRHLAKLAEIIEKKGWLDMRNFQWRIEGSHDYANLDPEKDEISEPKMVKALVDLWESRPKLKGKMRFESFKYLAHITNSFGWLGDCKTYWGPRFGFCDPQRGFHYVFSGDGNIYHCPRTIGLANFRIGDIENGFTAREVELKHGTILEKARCASCELNTLCGGGCMVQQKHYPDLDCRKYVRQLIGKFIELMRDRILERDKSGTIVSINEPWLSNDSK
jgi:uncharacterized protein